MPRSWDFALSKANGKFITFLADDDLLPRKFLQFYSKVVNLKENRRVKVFSHPNMNLKVKNNRIIER
jgi:hypothetical protein